MSWALLLNVGKQIMKILFFDVSTHVMYIGYAKDNEIVDYSIRLSKRDHAKHIVDRIHHVLERNQITLKDIDQIIVGRGPGSYTGIRIAGTVAKTLAYATNIPLYEVSSLIFMTSGYQGLVCAMLDARRDNVFSVIYEDGNIIEEDALRSLIDFKQKKTYKEANSVFIDEDTYSINMQVILKHAKRVDDIHAYEPFYARITEAEQRADQKR